MKKIEFTRDEKALLIKRLQRYFKEQLDHEIGQFEADFLIDFFTEEIGGCYYNRGIKDAQAIVQQRVDAIADAIDELEQASLIGR